MLVKSMTCMTRHAAAQLGETTHVANNFPVETVSPEGKTMTKLMRDSMPKPKRIHVTPPLPRPSPPKPQKPKNISSKISAWTPCEPPNKRARVASQNRKRAEERAAIEHAALAWRAADVGKAVVMTAMPNEPPPDRAFDRMLKRLRLNSSCTDGGDHTASFMRQAAPPVDMQAVAKTILKRAREVDQAKCQDGAREAGQVDSQDEAGEVVEDKRRQVEPDSSSSSHMAGLDGARGCEMLREKRAREEDGSQMNGAAKWRALETTCEQAERARESVEGEAAMREHPTWDELAALRSVKRNMEEGSESDSSDFNNS